MNGKRLRAFATLGNKMIKKPTYEELEKRIQILEQAECKYKKAKEALRKSETKMMSILRAAPIGICLVSNRILMDVNDQLCQLTGYSKDELVGKDSRLLYPTHKDYEDVGRETRILIQEKGTGTVETRFMRKDGKILDILLSLTPLAPQDITLGVTFTILDITDRKRVAQTLKQNQNQFESILSNIKCITYRCARDEDWTMLYMSPHVDQLTGYPPKDFINNRARSYKSIIHCDDAKMVSQRVNEAIAAGKSWGIEYRINHRDGGVRWVYEEGIGVVDSNGSIIYLDGFIINITDRKHAEEALQESEERLRAVFEAAKIVSFIIADAKDPDPVILEFSSGAENIFGYSRSEAIGRPVSILHVPQDNANFPGLHRKKEKGKIGFSGEIDMVRKSGEQFPALFSSYPLMDSTGKMHASLGVSIDISGQKALETKLFQAQKMEAIGNLAGGIAHDFNNLLFPIIGLSELLLEDLPSDSRKHRNVQQILQAGKRGADLVKQILTFSRQTDHEIKPVRIQKILKEVHKLTRSTIPSNIDIVQNVQEDCGLVMADPTQLHQIAMNLITNAYHALEQTGGKISLTLRETEITGNDATPSTLTPGRYVLLSVTDTGCGIDPKGIEKIFNPYYTTKDQGKGTGLGLAVVYGIVKEHHGDIKVQSELGKGSTFDVYLPLMEISMENTSIKHFGAYETGTERILLVDDEQPIVELERQMLERLGYHVTTRVSSVEALEAFKSRPTAFDLVITDMSMPNMTGVQFAKELMIINPDIPVIICTGFSEGITHDKAIAIGIKGFLMKPIIKSELAHMIRRVLDENAMEKPDTMVAASIG